MTSVSWLSLSAVSIGNHLWQSTMCAVAAAVLAFVLRKNGAQVRYRVWLAASLKFVIPFALLISAGGRLGWRTHASLVQPDGSPIFEVINQPFSSAAARVDVPHSAAAGSSITAAVPLILLLVWFAVCATILLTWCLRWRRMAAVTRGGTPASAGREVDALRRIEAIVGITRPIALVSTDTAMEPGVFGIREPVLLWPRTLSVHLDDAQIDAILAHEVAHVRRRDNLAAAVHLCVQAVFWFHPLVWWLGHRLVTERERACDEQVIRHGTEPRVYAESILKTCQFYIASPLPCIAGVTGSDLKTRVEAIMAGRVAERLSGWRKLLLATASAIAIAWPIAFGAVNAAPAVAQSAPSDAPTLAFEVASVKRNKSGDTRTELGFQGGGRFNAVNETLVRLIGEAYKTTQALPAFQIVGGPAWIGTDRFDVSATVVQNSSPEQRKLMLQALLRDRFKLSVHHDTRQLPIYVLAKARSDGRLGPQLRRSDVDCVALRAAAGNGPIPVTPGQARPCMMRFGSGQLNASGFTVSEFVGVGLSRAAGRPVVDRTGLEGGFDWSLEWMPDQLSQSAANASPADRPSLFTALQEQLGLTLQPGRGPVDVLVIDRAEHPTDN